MVEGMKILATINVLSWRQEMSSLNERMGELEIQLVAMEFGLEFMVEKLKMVANMTMSIKHIKVDMVRNIQWKMEIYL